MDREDFRTYGHNLVDWMADFFESIESYPVKSQVKPKEIINKLPAGPPEAGESFEDIFHDFQQIILPGITHWQHPKFFAYFPANSSYPSVLGEMLTAALGAQCMIWQTSPAAAELEERVMEWLRTMLGLPKDYSGVIQDSASSATLVALLTAREKQTNYEINEKGFTSDHNLTLYCSEETHSSIEKGAKIAGFGKERIRKIEVDDQYAMVPEKLESAIKKDREAGFTPCCVVATIGTTGSTAIDPLRPVGEICKKYDIRLHVDAALAGTAMVVPEHRWMIDGIEYADTFVFNPHKWMFTNFDCSAYFVRDAEALTKTFDIHPEYLKTKEENEVNNYRDWGVQLGRRFRSLKLWFVIRTYGVEGIRKAVQNHMHLANEIARKIDEAPDFERLAPVPLNTICFCYTPAGMRDREELNRINETLLETVNDTGEAYFTHTTLRGMYTIRFVIGQTYVEKRHVDEAWELIVRTAHRITGCS
jgi:aromatic-L-amino-acid/L-tryptophan decarboxylase